jgi:hypothetical protein
MSLKVTAGVIELCEQLVNEGYTGTIELTNNYPAGAAKLFGNRFSMSLTGFCKENLYIARDTHDLEYVFCGRYSVLNWLSSPTVKCIVDKAWDMYQTYKDKGFSRPPEFEKLFIKYGYLVERTVKVLEEQE